MMAGTDRRLTDPAARSDTLTRRSFVVWGAIGGAGLASTACATSSLVTGTYKVGNDYEITLQAGWADISRWMVFRPRGLRLLTADGPLLNRLYVTEGLKPSEFIVRPQSREQPTPTYRGGMSSRELVEFVTDSVAAMGYVRVESREVRPATFGAAPAIRFDIAAATPEGLEIAGAALLAERAKRLYLMLYLAPREHYFAARLGDVEKVFASATLPA